VSKSYVADLERAAEYQRLENWLDRAASINGTDGSYSSEFGKRIGDWDFGLEGAGAA
jgi:hypothetical protein